MKQSNIILGIGIIVAAILIAGSFFLKASPLENQSATDQIKPIPTISGSAKAIAIIPFRALSKHILKIK
jgi:hypothetical protein